MLPSTRFLSAALLGLAATTAVAEVTVKSLDDRVRVELDGQLFTEYRFKDTAHPCYYPIIGPNYAKMTRAWPMEESTNEDHDHPHHRSLWFSHGILNGVDYWGEEASYGKNKPKNPVGHIVHDKVVKTVSGKDKGEVVTTQNWVNPEGKTVVTSEQRLVLYSTLASERVFDFEITVKAGDEDAVFQETKESFAGMRIAQTMRAKGPKNQPGQGHILNSNGVKDGDVWGKEADWVVMSGPIADKAYSISFFDHPSNLRHPTRWHARDYGLFAPNPFGGSAMDPSLPKGTGDYTLKAGEKLNMRYRIVIEEGDADPAKIGAQYTKYQQQVP